MQTASESWYDILLVAEMVLAGIVFMVLRLVDAPYGKFARSGWGPTLPARYAWCLMELPAVLMIAYLFYRYEAWLSVTSIVLLIIWQSHYLHRTFRYPFQMAGGEKPYPWLLALIAVGFNLMNGFINGYHIFERAQYPTEWLTRLPFLSGLVLFAWGYLINKQSDRALRVLRSQHEGYQVPRGGMFRYVSNPHYLGEIMEWVGWAILTWSLAGVAFACFTLANLVPRAIATHRWYKREFADYPADRRVWLPFLW